MALSTGRDQALRAARDVQKGVVSYHGLFALLDSLKAKNGIERDVPDVRTKTFSAQTSTAATVVGGPCRLYGVRVQSGLSLQTAGDASNDVIVNLLDNGVGIARVKCTQDKDAEAYFFAGTDGEGIPCATNLTVSALAAADGSSNPSAADRPDITVYYGV